MSRNHSADAVIDQIAAAQYGVITRRQLEGIGLCESTIDRRVAMGRLRPVFRAVYQVGPILARHGRELAGALACGPDAALSHRTAAVIWECIPPSTSSDVVDVTVPVGTRRRLPGICAHRSGNLAASDVMQHESLPITTPVRTLFDLAIVVPVGELERAIALAERSGLASAARILERVNRSPGHAGTSIIRRVLNAEMAPAFTRSEAEALMLELMRRGRLKKPQVNKRLCGYEVDFFWPEERLVVEVDGFAYHASKRLFARDRRRDAELTASGYRVLRITWDDLTKHPEATLVTLAQALLR